MINENEPGRHTLEYAAAASAQPGRRSTLIELLVVLPIVALVITLLLPLGTRHHPSAILKSTSNLHHIGIAISGFCKTHSGDYPATLADLISDQLVRTSDLVAPGSRDTPASLQSTRPTTQQAVAALGASGHVTYGYLGRGWKAASVPADAIVAYEPAGIERNGSVMLFGDGTTQWIREPRATRLIAAASATTQPVSAGSVP